MTNHRKKGCICGLMGKHECKYSMELLRKSKLTIKIEFDHLAAWKNPNFNTLEVK